MTTKRAIVLAVIFQAFGSITFGDGPVVSLIQCDACKPGKAFTRQDSNNARSNPGSKIKRTDELQLVGVPDWLKTHEFEQDNFTFVRIRYGETDKPPGVPGRRRGSSWLTDYPDADLNFARQLGHETKLDVTQPSKVLRLTDPKLTDFPFIYISEPRNLSLTDDEIRALREYLKGGGFLMTDDSWGKSELDRLRTVLKHVFPNRAPIDLKIDHPLFHCVFDLKEKPQVTSIHHFLSGRATERADAPKANYQAIFDDNRRMMVLICHNTDLADGWERVFADKRYRREMSMARAFPMGINIVFYALQRGNNPQNSD